MSRDKRKIIITASRLALNLLIPFVAAGFGAIVWRVLRSLSIDTPRGAAFVLGGVAFIPVWLIGCRYATRVVNYLATLEHELTHLLVGLLFLKRPLSFRVTASEGGKVVLTGGNLWITLAPYYLPTLTFLIMPLTLVTGGKSLGGLHAILGASVIYHLFSTWGEVRVIQSDFRKAGILQTIWLLPVLILVFYGSVLAFIAGGFAEFIQYWGDGTVNSYHYLRGGVREFLLLVVTWK